MPDLKQCPFCGGEAELVDNGLCWDVSCKTKHCRGFAEYLNYDSKERAIEAWSHRAGEDSKNETVRCRDCKHAFIHPLGYVYCHRDGRNSYEMTFELDSSCSYGERKEGAVNEL